MYFKNKKNIYDNLTSDVSTILLGGRVGGTYSCLIKTANTVFLKALGTLISKNICITNAIIANDLTYN
jgi:hypothetical protein